VRTKTIDVMLTPENFQTGLIFIPSVDVLEQIPITGDDGSSDTGTNKPGRGKGGKGPKGGTGGTPTPTPPPVTSGSGGSGGGPGQSGNNNGGTNAVPPGTIPAPPAGSTPRRRS